MIITFMIIMIKMQNSIVLQKSIKLTLLCVVVQLQEKNSSLIMLKQKKKVHCND